MKRSEIQAGAEYAYSTHKRNSAWATPTRVRVVAVDRETPLYSSRRVDAPTFKTERYQIGVRRGLVVQEWREARTVRGGLGGQSWREAGWGPERVVEPRHLWVPWGEWEERLAADEAASNAAMARQEAREAAQQVRIDHFRSLVPAAALEGVRLEPGFVSRFSIEELIAIVEAARALALAEEGIVAK